MPVHTFLLHSKINDGTGLTCVDFCSSGAMRRVMNARGRGLGLSQAAPATLVLLRLAVTIAQLMLLAHHELELEQLTLQTVGVPLCCNADNL